MLCAAYEAVGLSAATAAVLAQRARECYLDPAGWTVFGDTLPVLTGLAAQGWRHVIVSNHVPELPALVEALGLGTVVDRVVTSALVGYEKPHREIFRIALELAGRPEIAWMVGDNVVADVLGAEQAGIRAILVRQTDARAAVQRRSPRGPGAHRRPESPAAPDASRVSSSWFALLRSSPRPGGRRTAGEERGLAMRVLVIGAGGREHALVWKLAQSPHVSALYCAPGNPGIADERVIASGQPVRCVAIAVGEHAKLAAFAEERRIALTVVGPDDPLGAGIVDVFQRHGLRIFGPPAMAARLEASKEFARDFMERHGVPTPAGRAFTDPQEARRYAARLGGRCAVKADGLALGKGVVVCHDSEEADRAIEAALVRGAFGAAGATILIQELVEGREVSLHALCDGTTARSFPPSKDHKRLGDGDVGPMTGGMGCAFPLPFVDPVLEATLRRDIVERTLLGCVRDRLGFRGLLYPGVMLTPHGPRTFELNVRFGDPETQAYLPLLETDLFELLDGCVDGRLNTVRLTWKPGACVCVVLAAPGYPGTMRTGQDIHCLADAAVPDTTTFHAGTARRAGRLVVAGGRVLTVTAWAATLAQARAKVYTAVEGVGFDGAQYRRDIASHGVQAAGA